MNREIKFRAIRQINEKSCWIYGYLVSSNEIKEYLTNEEDGKYQTCYIDPNTVGEYTGLKDKNGVDIYEGDIVEFGTGTSVVSYKENRDVSYGHGDCGETYTVGFEIGSSYGRDNKPLVIGNVHDNPELLKQ